MQDQITVIANPLLTSNCEKPLISAEKLRQLYAEMVRIRQDAKLHSQQKQRSNWRFQEAPAVGCTIDLRGEDCLIASRSDFPHVGNVRVVVLDATVDSFLALASGAALLQRVQARGHVVVMFAHDRQIGSNRELLRMAFMESLPIIYVEVERALAKTAKPARSRIQVPSIPVDKADVVAIYRVASEAIDKARRGAGPTLIQCVPFALKKVNAMDPHSQDPIEYMKYYLHKKNLWSDDFNRATGDSRWAGDGRMASSGPDDAAGR